MAGGIILSNRLRAMQDAAANFGDSIAGIRESQRVNARQAEQDKMAKAKFDQDKELGGLQIGAFKRRDAQELTQANAGVEAQGFADEIAGFGQDVPEQAIGLPGMQSMQSPRPVMDKTADGVKDRLRASMENAIAKSQGKVSALTASDIRKQLNEVEAKRQRENTESVFDFGEKKSKAARDAEKSVRDAAESKQTVKESKSREAKNYADIQKDKTTAVAGKTPSKEQFDAAGFGRRIEQATSVFEKLTNEGYNRASKSAGFGSMMPNSVKSSEAQQQDQAERNFINATLRRESGAAISPTEFENAEKQYFPRAGDETEVLKQKKMNRAQITETMRASAGNAWERVRPMVSADNDLSDDEIDAQLLAKGIDPVTGKRLKTKGGASGAF